ncbi:MAG: hypothetical protein KDC27_08860, partial [Acidobacteria bacterium]|nr:hypothetical protein [Acidobacteriota bacterium]
QAGLVAKLMQPLKWYRLEPAREALRVDGRPAGKPTAEDLTPPTHAEIAGELHAAYLPRGNGGRHIEIEDDGVFEMEWIDPRTGEKSAPIALTASGGVIALPERPNPEEDWVAILQKAGTGKSDSPQDGAR